MEGADAQVAAISGTFQRYKVLYHQRNVCVGFELLNDFVRVKCHGSNLARMRLQNYDRNKKKESVLEESDSFLVAGAGLERCDLRVMSPTSYQLLHPASRLHHI